MPPFGVILYLWRRERGLTQEKLAHRAGLSRPNLCAIECGRREVSLGTLRRLALGLGIRPGILVDGVSPLAVHPTPPALSRERIERIADAVAFDREAADPREQAIVEALRVVLGQRRGAIRHRRTPRAGRRKSLDGWAMLRSVYSREAIQVFAERVAERQRADASEGH